MNSSYKRRTNRYIYYAGRKELRKLGNYARLVVVIIAIDRGYTLVALLATQAYNHRDVATTYIRQEECDDVASIEVAVRGM